MKFYKNIFVTFLTSIITMIFVYGGYTIYAEGSYDFEEQQNFYAIKSSYNSEMNNYFNTKFKELNALLESPDFYDIEKNPQFHPPQNMDVVNEKLSSINRKCNVEGEPSNLSSICVSMGATEIYIAYVKKLETFKGTMGINGSSENESVNNFIQNYDAVIQELSTRSALVVEEVESAREALEATVAAYNEYRLAYPMHKKYQEIIENLIRYRSEMKDIHRRVISYPAKFVDASTSQCE